MNKDEILAASDEQLNGWCATEVLGYTLEYPQIRDARYRDSEGVFTGMRFNYAPTTNIAQAIALLDRLRDSRGGGWTCCEWELSTLAKEKRYLATVWWSGFTNFVCHEDDSKTRAIVIACLLAVAEMAQQTAAAGDAAQEGV